jgi:hypothetical protein
MTVGNASGLSRIHIELPNHPSGGGESMWALPLGSDLYELRNVPFLAYDLNLGDIVLATADSPRQIPEIRRVVKRNGHSTLRLLFRSSVPEKKRRALLQSLRFLSASFERGHDRLFALDLSPEADVVRVRAILDDWARKGWSDYETCEPRMPGSFDDSPEEGT